MSEEEGDTKTEHPEYDELNRADLERRAAPPAEPSRAQLDSRHEDEDGDAEREGVAQELGIDWDDGRCANTREDEHRDGRKPGESRTAVPDGGGQKEDGEGSHLEKTPSRRNSSTMRATPAS
jgi:hypothetical protein